MGDVSTVQGRSGGADDAAVREQLIALGEDPDDAMIAELRARNDRLNREALKASVRRTAAAFALLVVGAIAAQRPLVFVVVVVGMVVVFAYRNRPKSLAAVLKQIATAPAPTTGVAGVELGARDRRAGVALVRDRDV